MGVLGMGFLKRVLAGASPSSKVSLNTTYFATIRDDAMLPVVGEFYHQRAVATARPPGPNDLAPGLPPPPPGYYKALLTPEPANQYDRNAIAVYLWGSGSWSTVGYLSRTDAVNYQPVFRHLGPGPNGSPPAVACDAALVSERDGVGVVLHLGTPGECVVELATDHRIPVAHPWVSKPVVFSGHGFTTIYGVPLDREAQIMLARWAGCEVLPRVTKKAAALIVSDPNEPTANLQKAKEYGIPIVHEPQFVAALGVPPETIGRLSARWANMGPG